MPNTNWTKLFPEFLILINNINKEVSDTRTDYPIGDPDDIAELQISINAIFKWASQKNMEFNTEKFEFVKYGRNEDFWRFPQYTC